MHACMHAYIHQATPKKKVYMVYYSDFEKKTVTIHNWLAGLYSNGKTIYSKLLKIKHKGSSNHASLKKKVTGCIAVVEQFSVNYYK